VTAQDAWQYVLGIACANDVSAREIQRRDGQWMRGKGFDTFCPLGPWMRTGLAETDVADLAIRCRVNGELRQSARTREMAVSPARLIAFASGVMTLEPGDVIMTGTPAGISRLSAGDVVEVEIEGLGALRNPVRG
jgi:2-keto-4-pentenoate hydratase/2-oxohepta-3-ene-1,7-dioic acid hydratase in catechol pathway